MVGGRFQIQIVCGGRKRLQSDGCDEGINGGFVKGCKGTGVGKVSKVGVLGCSGVVNRVSLRLYCV